MRYVYTLACCEEKGEPERDYSLNTQYPRDKRRDYYYHANCNVCYRYGMSDYNLRWHYNTVVPRYIPAIIPRPPLATPTSPPTRSRGKKQASPMLDRTIESSVRSALGSLRRANYPAPSTTTRRMRHDRPIRTCARKGYASPGPPPPPPRPAPPLPIPRGGRCRAITRMRVTSNANYLFISLRMQPRRHAASDKGRRPLKLLRAPAFVHARPRPDNCVDYKNVRPRLARLYRYRPGPVSSDIVVSLRDVSCDIFSPPVLLRSFRQLKN
jgi:hypothetical protein